METDSIDKWISAVATTVASYRRMIDAAVDQLTDAELHERPRPDVNSVAVILRHLGGNLQSRWTDFLTTDGEKPNRDREREFADWEGDRTALLAHFEAGWLALTDAIQKIDASNIHQPVFIRGERHTIADALVRSVTHLSYHVGQIAMVARLVHKGEWRWLTIPPGKSAQHNSQTWGTAASRSVLADETGSP